MSDESDSNPHNPQKIYGILIGVMMSPDGPRVGISLSGQGAHIVNLDHAAFIMNQIGDLLESLGYFNECGNCEGCEDPPKEGSCKPGLH